MNCERFQTMVADLARNQNRDTRQEVEATDRAEALAHIDNCDRCGQILTDQNDLSEKLGSLADSMRFLQAPAQVGQQLLATFGAQTQARSRRSTRPHWRYWVSAAAAVLLLTFGLVVWRWHIASMRQSPAEVNAKSTIAPPSQ